MQRALSLPPLPPRGRPKAGRARSSAYSALACAQSLKGVSGDVIILEEAAYCDPGLIAEVVVPLLSMQQSVLLCISTILDSGNHYTKMMELQDDLGKKVFETISITLVRAPTPFYKLELTYCFWLLGVRRMPPG